jgi:hypothetical protein
MAPTVTVVNLIPQSLSGETNFDSEPNLAVNPANPLQIVASAFTPNPAGSGDAPVFLSTDGGNTWSLQAIVPSQIATFDITVRFGSTSNNLYAGIIKSSTDQNAPPEVNILRTTDVTSGAEMTVLVDRAGQGVDQPYIQATTSTDGQGNPVDIVICGDNDFNLNPQTANIDISGNGAANPPNFSTTAVDTRAAANGDAPSIRPAIHSDGTVYVAFLRRTGGNNPNFVYDVVVTRDDRFGTGNPPFSALTDPGDNGAGVRIAQNRLIPFINDAVFGQERIGSSLSIAVDLRNGQSGTVYVAWADRVSQNDYTIHLLSSSDRGQTWSQNDLLTITNATNPALAINSDGVVAFVYQALTGNVTPGSVTSANRWETHFRTSSDSGQTWSDLLLSTTPADQPSNAGPTGPKMLPYLGDYLHLMAIGKDFYGVFSANNTPDPANFPNGVVFQRNTDQNAHTLLDVDGQTPVGISIDPFFFKITL